MGLITIDDIKGIGRLIGFGKSNQVKQSNRTFPYDEGFATSSDVYAVTGKIAKNGKTIPWILKKDTNGKIEEVTEGELYDLIQNPNENQSTSEFVEKALLFLFLSGEVFEQNKTLLGFESEINSVELINPQLLDLEVKCINGVYSLDKYRLAGSREPLDKDSITHLKYANPTLEGERSLRGFAPLVAGCLTLQGLNKNQEANVSILDNQGAAGILSNESDIPYVDAERQIAQTAFDKIAKGILKWGKIVVSPSKVKFIRLGLDPTQLKLIESKLLKFRDLCNIYDVKSILFNDPVNASFNNLSSAEKQLWTNAVIPNTQLIVDMFTKGVVDIFNKQLKGRGRYFIELDIKSIIVLQEDQAKEAKKDKTKMEGVNIVMNMPITEDARVALLVSDYGYTEEDAKVIAVKPEPTQNEGE